MATLVVTKSYTSGSAKANLIFTYTYSVSNNDAQTTLTPSSLKVSTSESGSGNDLTAAKNKRFVAVSLGLDTTVTFNGATLVDKKVSQDSGSVSISTTARNVAKTHAAQSKALSMTVDGTTKSATITVPAKPSYAVTYNGNGGSGAPSAQTKWYGETLTLSTTKPTRTNYVFKNWNTAAAGTGTAYASGASYTGNAALTLYAQWYAPYTVSYNANGGTGAPASQVKVYNTTLYLSTTVPTRTDFAFLRWNTNSAGSGTNYASGASYTANANATLYAQWQRTYADPKVTIGSVQRVDATEHESDDDGTSVAVTFSWSLFDTPSGTNHPTDATVTVTDSGGVTKATLSIATLTGTTGTHTAYLDANCDTNQPYVVTITLTDEGGSSRSATVRSTVPTVYFPIDIRQGGRGVAIGGPAYEDALDIYMPTRIVDRGDGSDHPLRIVNDEAVDVLTVDWDGNVVAGGNVDVGGYVHALDSRFDAAASSLSENVYLSWGMMDELARYIMFMQGVEYTTGMTAAQIAARKVVNGANVDNALSLRVANDGTRSVVVSAADAWLSALGLGYHGTSVTLSNCTVSGNACWHAGNVGSVTMTGVKLSAALASGSSKVIGTVPAGHRPPQYVYATAGSTNATFCGRLLVRITSAGEVSVSNYSGSSLATTVAFSFTITYALNALA